MPVLSKDLILSVRSNMRLYRAQEQREMLSTRETWFSMSLSFKKSYPHDGDELPVGRVWLVPDYHPPAWHVGVLSTGLT